MTPLNRRRFVRFAIATSAACLVRPPILAQNGYPSAGTRNEQWRYIRDLAANGFQLLRRERELNGDDRRDVFRQRATVFHRAAKHIEDFLGLHFATAEDRRSQRYVFARFCGGLYKEYATDFWSALNWYRSANRQIELGVAPPQYRGRSIATLLPDRIARVERLSNLSEGGVRPRSPTPHQQSTTSIRIQLYGESEAPAALQEFALENSAAIPDLFGPLPEAELEMVDEELF